MRRAAIFFLLFFLLSPIRAFATLTVTVTNCAGDRSIAGSLPWALDAGRTEPTIIDFDIPSAEAGFTTEAGISFWRIKPKEKMSLIGNWIEVKGSTQASRHGDLNPDGPEIVVDGSNMTTTEALFNILAVNQCTIEGITINNSKGFGINISTGIENHIYDCYIGTDASGETSAPNASGGIYLDNAAMNMIGGEGIGCVISGNGGSGIVASNTVNTTISGNMIGTKRNGQSALGNAGNGISLNNGAKAQYVATGNVIAFNGTDGVLMDGGTTNDNTLAQNSFFSNSGKGIHLINGANNGISSPSVATSEFYSSFGFPGTLFVSGSAPANSTIEIMKTESPEVESNGEGRSSLGFTLSDDSGGWFVYLATAEVKAGEKVCATATDAVGNTSEFSNNLSVVTGTIVYRPDAMIGLNVDGSDYIGENIFNKTGYGQTKSKVMSSGETAIYYLKIKNSGNVSPDRMVISGTGSSTDWQISYYDSKSGSNDVTAQVTGAGLVTRTLASSESIEMRMAVMSTGKLVNTKEAFVTVSSYNNTSRVDTVKSVTSAFFSPTTDRYSIHIITPAEVESGRPFTLTLEARDRSGQLTTEVSGYTHLSVDAGMISVTSLESAQFAGNGVWQGGLILSNVGDRTLSVSNDYIAGISTTTITVKVPQDVISGGLNRFGPNPYNPSSGEDAVFWYWLDKDDTVSINLFDLKGSLVFKRIMTAGSTGGKVGVNSVNWNGRNVNNEMLENGLYLVKIASGSKSIYSGKIIILK